MSGTVEALLRELTGALETMAGFVGATITKELSVTLGFYCERIEEVLRNER